MLPPGAFPARIPFVQTLTDGDKCGPEPWKSSKDFFILFFIFLEFYLCNILICNILIFLLC